MKKNEYIKNVSNEFNLWARKGMGEKMEKGHFKTARYVLEELRLESVTHVLDLSCGNGWAMDYFLKEKVPFVYGTDISIEMLNNAREKLKKNFNKFFLIKANAEHLPFKSSTFNIVFNMEAFYYYLEPERVLEEVYRILKKNGLFLLLTDYYKENNVSSKWGERLKIKMKLFSIDEYISLLKIHGFHIEKVYRIIQPEISGKQDFIPSNSIKSYEEYRDFKRAGTLYILSKKL